MASLLVQSVVITALLVGAGHLLKLLFRQRYPGRHAEHEPGAEWVTEITSELGQLWPTEGQGHAAE